MEDRAQQVTSAQDRLMSAVKTAGDQLANVHHHQLI
jgi:hypothetical protein